MATDAISVLGAGSGMDIKALTTSLVDAERVPRKDAIDKKITKSESAISGYGAIKFVLDGLNTAFANLKDQSDFSSLTTKNSQSNSVSVTTTSLASAANHQVTVSSLAKADSWISDAFTSPTASLNGGSSFSLRLTVNGVSQGDISLAPDKDTPEALVTAINSANKGLTAQIVSTGDAAAPYKVMVTGKTGANQGFTLSSATPGVSFGTQVQTCANAVVNINGMNLTPSSNKMENFFPGVSFEFLAPTASVSTTSVDGAGATTMVSTPVPANINLIRDTPAVRTKVEALVKAYNDANSLLTTVYDPKSTVETYGGSLAGNSIVNTVRSMMREMVFTDSDSPSGGLTNMRDLGISLDKVGTMTFDGAKFDTVLTSQFDNVVTLLTGNTEGLSAYSTQNAGAAGGAIRKLSTLLSSTGILSNQTTSINKRISDYKLELTKLEDRMTQLKERYIKQFAAMESIVGQSKSLKSSLSSTFDGMMASYTNK
jgi:flagellar hook-associated protein 2